jgi:hypothetical protein
MGLVRPVVSRAESARYPPPSIEVITAWSKATRTGLDPLIDLMERCKSGKPDWFVPYAAAEAAATSLRLWGPLLVPGLVQTEDYARAVLELGSHTGARLEELLTTRMDRQRLIGRARITVVIDHMVLQRPLGSPQVMADQCGRLIGLAECKEVHVHVVPYGTSIGLYGAFDIATRDGSSTVNLTSLRDVSSTDATLGEEALGAFDDILAAALPRAASIDCIRIQRDKWKDQS